MTKYSGKSSCEEPPERAMALPVWARAWGHSLRKMSSVNKYSLRKVWYSSDYSLRKVLRP